MTVVPMRSTAAVSRRARSLSSISGAGLSVLAAGGSAGWRCVGGGAGRGVCPAGEDEGEGGLGPGTGDDEAAAVGFGEVTGQGEADAVAAGVGVAADEGGAEGVGGEPWAGVGNLDSEAGAGAAGGDTDRAGAVLESIRDQDVEDVVNDGGGGAGQVEAGFGVDSDGAAGMLREVGPATGPALFQDGGEVDRAGRGERVAGAGQQLVDRGLDPVDTLQRGVDRLLVVSVRVQQGSLQPQPE